MSPTLRRSASTGSCFSISASVGSARSDNRDLPFLVCHQCIRGCSRTLFFTFGTSHFTRFQPEIYPGREMSPPLKVLSLFSTWRRREMTPKVYLRNGVLHLPRARKSSEDVKASGSESLIGPWTEKLDLNGSHLPRTRRGACDFATSLTQSIKACFSNLSILLLQSNRRNRNRRAFLSASP